MSGIDDPGGDDPDHSRVPVISPYDHRTVPGWIEPAGNLFLDFGIHALIGLPTFRVAPLEISRESLRFARIRRHQELNAGIC
jgi:hypothetical protein